MQSTTVIASLTKEPQQKREFQSLVLKLQVHKLNRHPKPQHLFCTKMNNDQL